MDHLAAPLHAVSLRPVESLEGARLLVLLHGYGADERDLLPVAEVVGQDAVAVALRGPVPVGAGAGWADGSTEQILSGEGLHRAADAVLAWLDELVARLGEPAEVQVLGFSQGGATALAMLRRAPARFRRMVVLAGFVATATEPGDAALAADPPAVYWGRGDADTVIPEAAILRTAHWLSAHTLATVSIEPGLGHGVSATQLAQVAAFLA